MAGTRCEDCAKFVGLENQEDPTVELLGIEHDGETAVVEYQVEVVLCCAECSTELKAAALEGSVDLSDDQFARIKDHLSGADHDLQIEETSICVDDQEDKIMRRGFALSTRIFCSCNESDDLISIDIRDHEEQRNFEER